MKRSLILLTAVFLLLLPAIPTSAQTPVVKAILFYSPFCGHCHKVINEDIPPISARFNEEVVWSEVPEETAEESGGVPTFIALQGDSLQILFVNTTTPAGNELFAQAIEAYQIPDPVGVPTLIVADRYMIGSAEIPAQFPEIVASGLEGGGLDWPEISGLEENIAGLIPIPQNAEDSTDPEANSAASEESAAPETELQGQPESVEEASADQQPDLVGVNTENLSIRQRVLSDPVGNTLSILVLIGMVLSVVGVGARWATAPRVSSSGRLHWSLLVLILVGIGVASYLTFIESTGTEAVCGPVGDCNTVQSSRYAVVFGVLPVGALGLAGYAALLIAWFVISSERQPAADYATIGFFLLGLLGTFFSIYLTFLEPFVIGATCIWCLSSAVIMTAITILSVDAARQAFHKTRTS